jgi:hypothetical protein
VSKKTAIRRRIGGFCPLGAPSSLRMKPAHTPWPPIALRPVILNNEGQPAGSTAEGILVCKAKRERRLETLDNLLLFPKPRRPSEKVGGFCQPKHLFRAMRIADQEEILVVAKVQNSKSPAIAFRQKNTAARARSIDFHHNRESALT